jgi:TBCC domain-containing protein 1
VSNCIAHGRQLSWLLAGENREAWTERRRGHIASNLQLVPKDNIRGNKLVVMSQVSRQTVARSSSTLENSAVKIHRCHNAFIYLLSPLRSVSIEKCQRTTIVLGPVETSVDLIRCEDTTVIVASRRVTMIGCKGCRLHVMTPNRPLVFGSNESLTFAPYHTHYPRLGAHMTQVGLQPRPNFWDQPLFMGSDYQEDDVWKLLDPSEFFEFKIPFEMDGGDTQEVPNGLPDLYQAALTQRHQSVETWRGIVRKAGLTKDQKTKFQDFIESRSQEWLRLNGHLKQLQGLIALNAE